MDQEIIGVMGMIAMLHIICYGVEHLMSGVIPAFRWLIQFEKWAWRSGWMALGDLLHAACDGIAGLFGGKSGGKKKKKT